MFEGFVWENEQHIINLLTNEHRSKDKAHKHCVTELLTDEHRDKFSNIWQVSDGFCVCFAKCSRVSHQSICTDFLSE